MCNHESEIIEANDNSPHVPDAPHLEPEALAIFERHVTGASCYLEYGAGGSTVHAARNGARHIITVDSSYNWAEAVRFRVGPASHVNVLYCDIGEVGPWGRPRDDHGLHGYHAYMSAPWEAARRQAQEPSVILVDGRFRVACFLYSLLCAHAGTIILFDDYATREHYHVVEEFSQSQAFYGRMAVFEVNKSFALPAIVSRIAQYSIISD